MKDLWRFASHECGGEYNPCCPMCEYERRPMAEDDEIMATVIAHQLKRDYALYGTAGINRAIERLVLFNAGLCPEITGIERDREVKEGCEEDAEKDRSAFIFALRYAIEGAIESFLRRRFEPHTAQCVANDLAFEAGKSISDALAWMQTK